MNDGVVTWIIQSSDTNVHLGKIDIIWIHIIWVRPRYSVHMIVLISNCDNFVTNLDTVDFKYVLCTEHVQEILTTVLGRYMLF